MQFFFPPINTFFLLTSDLASLSDFMQSILYMTFLYSFNFEFENAAENGYIYIPIRTPCIFLNVNLRIFTLILRIHCMGMRCLFTKTNGNWFLRIRSNSRFQSIPIWIFLLLRRLSKDHFHQFNILVQTTNSKPKKVSGLPKNSETLV